MQDTIKITFYHMVDGVRKETPAIYPAEVWEAMTGTERENAAYQAALRNGLEVGYRVDG